MGSLLSLALSGGAVPHSLAAAAYEALLLHPALLAALSAAGGEWYCYIARHKGTRQRGQDCLEGCFPLNLPGVSPQHGSKQALLVPY